MFIKAEQRNSRQSPRKVRLAMTAIKGMSVPTAVKQLAIMDIKASKVVLLVLQQAIANAKNNLGLNVDDLEIHELLANTGSTYRRFRAVSRGRGHSIQKKTTHVRIVLKTKEVKNPPSPKATAGKAEKKQIRTINKKDEKTAVKRSVNTDVKKVETDKNPPSSKVAAGKAEKKQIKTDKSKKKVAKKK